MTASTLITFSLTSLVLGMVPGPSVCLAMSHSLRLGVLGAIPGIVGQLSANLVQLTVVGFGLQQVLHSAPVAFSVIKAAGAVYLVYIGLKQLVASRGSDPEQAELASENRFKLFGEGFVVCGTNPKALLYYAAFLPQFLHGASGHGRQLLLLGAISMLGALVALASYTLLAGSARRWLIERSYWRAMYAAVGCLMVGAGVWLATQSV